MSPNGSRPATMLLLHRLRSSVVLGALALVMVLAGAQVLCAVEPEAAAQSEVAAQPEAVRLTMPLPLAVSMPLPVRQHLKVSATLPPGMVGVAYNAVISVSGGVAPYEFREQNLPSGLVLNQHTGGISGTPQVHGQFAFSVWVFDQSRDAGLAQFKFTINSKTSVGINLTPTSTTLDRVPLSNSRPRSATAPTWP